MTATERDVRVLIADDEELTRAGLATLLSRHPGVAVAGVAADGDEAVSKVDEVRPDVVLMDVRMPVLDGIAATRRLRRAPEPVKVIAITTFESDEYVYAALHAGAQGFVLKRAPVATIGQAVRMVADSDCLLFPEAVRRLVTARPHPGPQSGDLSALTVREAEILRLMATGLSNRDIAARLFVSLETVKTHVGNVLLKLNVDNRTQAVIAAFETGFVRP